MSLVLLDTQLLVWSAAAPNRLTPRMRQRLVRPVDSRAFSVISIWEVAIKAMQGRADFQIDPHRLRSGLLDRGFREIPVTGEHALAVLRLPPLHRDPFDRMLIAQAATEGAILLTTDVTMARYPGAVELAR